MRIMLDTHTFLWWIDGSDRLSQNAMNLLADPKRGFFLSVASIWELAIKIRLEKINLSEPLDQFVVNEMKRNKFRSLDITIRHVTGVSTLPLHHRDPFDRLIISQSLVEGMPILGADRIFDAYGVERLW